MTLRIVAGLFIQFLAVEPNLWQNTARTVNFCDWVRSDLFAVPAYYKANGNTQSVAVQLGKCYPDQKINSMPILEQEANKAKNLAMQASEKPLIGETAPQLRDATKFAQKCATSQVALLRSAAGVISYMNDFQVQSEFLKANRCVRKIWSGWYGLYLASTAVDAPNRAQVNAPNVYDNWIHTIIAGMPGYLQSEVARLIQVVPNPSTISLSFNVILDDASLDNQVPVGDGIVHNVVVTQAQLTAQIQQAIGTINWINQLPTH